MGYWLFKEEPTHYSYADLERDGHVVWDGVANNLALQHLRALARGDRIWFYHTGKAKEIVGEMMATSAPRPGADSKAVIVDVAPVRRLPRPVTLREIKEDPKLASWDLVRLPRLSIVPVTPTQWRRVEALAKI
jgi:predicted RNA-binding protein with PUA-like domain